MNSLRRALSAETLKLKRTLALWLALIAPLAIVFVAYMLVQMRGQVMNLTARSAWHMLVQNAVLLWAILMLPLFITLETALLAGLEHGNHSWKQLYALPIPRWAIYAAKQFAGLVVMAISTASLAGMIVLAGLLLRTTRPGLGFEQPVPWGMIAQGTALSYAAALLLIALHTFIALRWPSFVVACMAGIVLTIPGVMIVESDYGQYYPWTLPTVAALRQINGEPLGPELWIALVAAVAVMVVGAWQVTRRDVE